MYQSKICIMVLARWYLTSCDEFNSCCPSLEDENSETTELALWRIILRLLPSIVWRYSTKVSKCSLDI